MKLESETYVLTRCAKLNTIKDKTWYMHLVT